MAVAASWCAEIQRAAIGGVHFVIRRPGQPERSFWFKTAAAALADPRARQFCWRESRAIGSPTLYRGDLVPWEQAS